MSEKLPTILLKINVSQIQKERLFRGERGTYLDCVLVPVKEQSNFGDDRDQQVYMVVQSVTKAEREAGKRGPIIGNGKFMPRKQDAPSKPARKTSDADLPDGGEQLPF